MTDVQDIKPDLRVVGEPIKPKAKKLERPCFAVYEKDTMVDGKTFHRGTWHHGIKYIGPEEKPAPFDHWLCAPLRVDALTINAETGNVGRLLSFEFQGRTIEWVATMDLMVGKGDDLLKKLALMGLPFDRQNRHQIPNYLSLQGEPARTIHTTIKTGWHGTQTFVLPGRVIGSGDIRYQQQMRTKNLFSSQGTLENWNVEVGKYCLRNPVMILSVATALAGPLLAKVGVNGGGVHLIGDSSSGKSLAQLVAASVWGDPATFAASWDMTKGGVETEAVARNDTVLILDEIKRADPKHVEEMAYQIANGTGRSTMTRDRESRERLEWRVLALSSGERSLAEHAAISGNSAHAGAELRLVDVDAGNRPYKAFDDIHEMPDSKEFHRKLTELISRYYGQLGPAFVESLISDAAPHLLRDRFRQVSAEFATKNAQAGRVADRFAVIALAGEEAISRKLLDWPPNTVLHACQLLFNEWVARMGDGNLEDRQILRSVNDFIEVHGSRFSNLKPPHGGPGPEVHNRAGYFEEVNGKVHFLFFGKALTDAAPGFSSDRIVKALQNVDAIAEKDSSPRQVRFTKKKRTPGPDGRPVNFYVIDPSKLTK